jgi:hypothetical protein
MLGGKRSAVVEERSMAVVLVGTRSHGCVLERENDEIAIDSGLGTEKASLLRLFFVGELAETIEGGGAAA